MPKKVQPLQMTFELVDSKPSSYVMDAPGIDSPEEVDQTARISFPSLRKIRNTSRIKVNVPGQNGQPDTFTYKKIRYIAGCPFLDFDKQVAEGWKTNYLADIIMFKAGRLTESREGDLAKYDYLMQCEYNVNAEDRPEDAEDVFKQLNPVLDAEGEEIMIDLKAECSAIIRGLKAKSENGFRYNTDALEFYCSLFKFPSFASGYSSEAWVALANFADDEPERFLNSIAKARSIVESDVFNAMSLGVITMDQSRAFLTDGNIYVTEFETGLNAQQKGQALVDFMSNPKNRNHYDNMRVRVQQAKVAKVDIVK